MFQLLPCRNTQRIQYEAWSINPVREIGIYCELYTVFFTVHKPGVIAELA